MDITPSQPSSAAETNTDSKSSSPTESGSRPAALSLYGIARRYCREEILVSPLRWTGRHLELLQCSFSGPLPEPVTAAATSVTEADYSDERTGTPYLHDFFNYYYKAPFREQGIRFLLTTDQCPLIAICSIDLYLGTWVTKKLLCTTFYLRNSSPESTAPLRPIAAFVDRGHVEMARRDSMGGYRCRLYNYPILRLYDKKWKKICPPDPLYDPYIVALLISLAQKKRGYLQSINSKEEVMAGMLSSQVLSTFYSKGKCKEKSEEAFLGWMYLYTADIPSSLLDMFDHPNVPPSAPPSIQVKITTILYRPLATLRARLLALLLPETLVGATYNPSPGRKRKFEGEDDHHRPCPREAPSE
ncbi:hypothetical protein V8C37DRAFT_140108 [Trichoderma ceciliae]